MVKVSGGARTLAGVERHMKYIEKKGASGLETDMDTRAGGQGFARELVTDWELDVEALKHYSKKTFRGKPPKLVHNIVFSMPAGTSPLKVLAAVRKLAVDEWALEHRFAMALHIDGPHPHVHVVLKAVSEQGVRLNIRKATLREWRTQFAANLREVGVAANATERAVRGETRTHHRTAVYRAAQRGESSYMRRIRDSAINEGSIPNRSSDVGYAVLNRTRRYVVASWQELASGLIKAGEEELAREIHEFLDGMPEVQTEKQILAQSERSATWRPTATTAEQSR
jgi:type IV secretory pathway VirD2 relaxase